MSVINLLQCDEEGCKARVELTKSIQYDIPEDWLVVFQERMQGSEGYHFCSYNCLHSWSRRRHRETIED